MHRANRCRLIHTLSASVGVTLLLVVGSQSALADVFLLRSGGQVEGDWLNREQHPLTTYHVRTAQGVIVQLQATDVQETLRQSAEQVAYEKLAPSESNSVEGHWRLAEWCRRNGLAAQRSSHLRQIIALDTNHQGARRALGYAFVDGRWITQDDFRHEEGYEYYKGRWRTAQEIEIFETRAKHNLAEREWLARLKRYRLNMNDRNKAESAYAAMRAVKDPVAVRPLAALLGGERVRTIKMLYVDVLASIDTGDSAQALVYCSLNDSDEEIFYYCVERLARMKRQSVIDSYVAALKDSENAHVNKAAVALAKLNDTSAVSPLIDALITTHARVTPSALGADATAVSFGSGGTSMMKNEGPKVQIARVQNQHVLDTLTKLSRGSNFGFDQRAWRYWYAQEKKIEQAGQRVERRSGS
jgi:hypothetical protein